MRAVVQRVSRASVTVDGEVVVSIGRGLCVLLGIAPDDSVETALSMARKLWELRIFPDAAGAMNRSASDLGVEVLVVSQFTLYGDTRKGRRPSFVGAAPGPVAEPLVEAVVAALSDLGAPTSAGRFGADMAVELVNDGPVTLLIDL